MSVKSENYELRYFQADIENVQESLGKIEKNFRRLKRQISSFDFKKEMVHVLESNQDDGLSPLDNLFNQTVQDLGGIFEATECGCEQLLDQLIQIEERKSRVCKEEATESFASEEAALRVTFKSETEVVIHVEIKDEVKHESCIPREAPKKIIKSEIKVDMDDSVVEISGDEDDPESRSKETFFQTKHKRITNQLDSSSSGQEKDDSMYLKEQADSSDEEISFNDDENEESDYDDSESDDFDEIKSPSKRARTWPAFSSSSEQNGSSKTPNSKSQPTKNKSSLSINPFTSTDPTKLAQTIKNLLQSADVSHRLFAEKVLNISLASFNWMIYHPRSRIQWEECTDELKRRYQIMHEWSQAPEKSIERLKVISSRRKARDHQLDSSSHEEKNESHPARTTSRVSSQSKHPIVPIDTAELSKNIKNTLNSANIRRRLFAEQVVGISLETLHTLLNPFKDSLLKPWTEYTDEMKQQYHIMHEWSQAPEKSLEHLKAMSIKENNSTIIDPIMLSEEVTFMLKEAKIHQFLFAKEVLGITIPKFHSLIHYPKTWTQWSDSAKQYFRKMNDWIRSPHESIKRLKAVENNDEFIDTAELTNSVKNILIEHEISKTLFAKEVFGTNVHNLNFYIHRPAPWTECTDVKKDFFRKLHQWIKSPTVTQSISSLRTLSHSIKKKYDYGEGEEELDVFKIAEKVDKLVKKLGISKSEFFKKLDVPLSLIKTPAPWHLLTKYKKVSYRKIHEWLIENEKDELYNSTSEEEGDEEIDTVKVSREIVQLLKTHGLCRFLFATHKLGISSVYFKELVFNPKPWKELHQTQRDVFKKIEIWTLADSDELNALKLEHMARIAERNKQRNQKRKEIREKML